MEDTGEPRENLSDESNNMIVQVSSPTTLGSFSTLQPYRLPTPYTTYPLQSWSNLGTEKGNSGSLRALRPKILDWAPFLHTGVDR